MQLACHTLIYPKEVVLFKIVSIGWFIGKIISFKVWISDRYFPVIPVFNFLQFSNQVHFIIFFISLLLIGGLFFYPLKRHLVLAVIVIEFASCLLDYMRWQPWEYQYLLTLIFFLFSRNSKHFLSLVGLLIAVTYLFSGLHKFSGSFLYIFWDSIILKKIIHISDGLIKNPFVHYFGLIFPAIEIFIGVGILFFRNKKNCAILAILMHLFILLLFGPLGLNYNIIIVPWNLVMLGLVLILFYHEGFSNLTLLFFNNIRNISVLVVIVMMPILSFFGNWDDYLSFNLYSGNTKTLSICVDKIQKYPELEKRRSKLKNDIFCNGSYLIDTNTWALEELKVPVYPEERVFKIMKDRFNQKYPNIKNKFVYYNYPYQNKNINEVK